MYSRHTSRAQRGRSRSGKKRARALSAKRSGTPYLGTRTPPIRTATLRAASMICTPASISCSLRLFSQSLSLSLSRSRHASVDTFRDFNLVLSPLFKQLSPKTFLANNANYRSRRRVDTSSESCAAHLRCITHAYNSRTDSISLPL